MDGIEVARTIEGSQLENGECSKLVAFAGGLFVPLLNDSLAARIA